MLFSAVVASLVLLAYSVVALTASLTSAILSTEVPNFLKFSLKRPRFAGVISAAFSISSILVRAGLPEVPAILGRASAIAAISPPGGGKKAYTMKMIASVIRPAVRKKSAHLW